MPATTFREKDVVEILGQYELGEYSGFEPFSQGSVQTNLLLNTSSGRCVLRYYEQGRTYGSVLFEVNLLRYLTRRSYPAPAPLRNIHGAFAGSYKHKPYVLFEYLEGQHVQSPTEEQHRQLIQKAAELHTLTRGYRPAYKHERWNYGVRLCHSLAAQAATKLGTADARAKLHWHSRQLAQLQLPSSLPKGICHADFHFSNVLFKNDSFAALLDFDDANYTFLLFDLVGLIEPAAWPYAAHALDLGEAKRVVTTYMRYRLLNHTERRHLFDVYKLSILIDCVWYFARGDSDDFYEKHKIEHLDAIGRDRFYHQLFDSA